MLPIRSRVEILQHKRLDAYGKTLKINKKLHPYLWRSNKYCRDERMATGNTFFYAKVCAWCIVYV